MSGAEEKLALRWAHAMQEGDFERAWQESEQVLRLRRLNPSLQEGRPLWERDVWDGTPVEGKKLLVRCHHGLGDTIQFIRFCARVRPRVSRLMVKAQAELLPLLASVDGIDALHSELEPDPPHDVAAEVMELPFIERTRLDNLPARVPYIEVPYAHALPEHQDLRVGLCWGVGSFLPERGVPFSMLASIQSLPGLRFYSLQKGMRARDGTGFPFELGLEAPAEIVATGALMKKLDLVISVDSMVAHLAGALGVRVWTLLHSSPDWRWLKNRGDSPWYPSMKLFRQPAPGDWAEVVAEVKTELQRLLAQPV